MTVSFKKGKFGCRDRNAQKEDDVKDSEKTAGYKSRGTNPSNTNTAPRTMRHYVSIKSSNLGYFVTAALANEQTSHPKSGYTSGLLGMEAHLG